MKKILILCAVTCLAVTVPAQTNVVKISALPTGNAITGTELVPVDQNNGVSNVTIQVTVNQLTAIPLNYAQGASNFVLQVVSTNAANDVANSNRLNANIAGDLLTSNAMVNVSNQVLAANSALGTVSNSLNYAQAQIQNATNTANFQQTEISSLSSSNSFVFGTITAINLFINNAATNGGQGTYSRIVTPATLLPATTGLAGQVVTNQIDFRLGSYQSINVGLGNSGNPLLFQPINFTNGDNVFLYVYVTNGVPGWIGSSLTVSGGRVDSWVSGASSTGGGASLNVTGGTKEAVLNWTVERTNLIYTESIHN